MQTKIWKDRVGRTITIFTGDKPICNGFPSEYEYGWVGDEVWVTHLKRKKVRFLHWSALTGENASGDEITFSNKQQATNYFDEIFTDVTSHIKFSELPPLP